MSDPETIAGTAPTPIPFGLDAAISSHAADDTAVIARPAETTDATSSDVHIDFDFGPVSSAGGAPNQWAAYLRQYLGHITGVWLDQEDLTDVFHAYSGQVAAGEAREAFFTVSNMAVPSKLTGDPSLIALQMRADLASLLKRRANLS